MMRSLSLLSLSMGLMFSANTALAEGALPQLDTASFPSQIFWLVISFSILYLVVSRAALPRIAQILQRRMRNIDADYSAARKFRREVESHAAETQELLNQGRQAAQELLRSKHQSLQAEITKQQEQEQHKIGIEIGEHEQKVADAKNDALAKIDDIASELIEKCVVMAGGSKPTEAHLSAALKD